MEILDVITEEWFGWTFGCGTLALLAAFLTVAGILIARGLGTPPILGALGAWTLICLAYKAMNSVCDSDGSG